MQYDTYRHLIGEGEGIRQLLDRPGGDETRFELPHFKACLFQALHMARWSFSTA